MSGDVHVRFCERLGVQLPRATHLVLLTRHRPTRERAWIQQVLARLGLTLHAAKTQVLDARRTDFVFLGHTHRWRSPRLIVDVAPKAQRRIRDELRQKTRRTGASLPALIADLNPYSRGARQYFHRVRRRTLDKLDRFVEERIARWWAHKHAHRRPAWSLVHGKALWRHHGLERWYRPGVGSPAASRPVT